MKSAIVGGRQPILWGGMRQLESVMEALRSTLNGYALPSQFRENPRRGLRDQGIEFSDDVPKNGMFSRAIFEGFAALFGTPIDCYVLAKNAPDAGPWLWPSLYKYAFSSQNQWMSWLRNVARS